MRTERAIVVPLLVRLLICFLRIIHMDIIAR